MERNRKEKEMKKANQTGGRGSMANRSQSKGLGNSQKNFNKSQSGIDR